MNILKRHTKSKVLLRLYLL